MIKGYVFKLAKGVVQIKAENVGLAHAVMSAAYPGQFFELIEINEKPL